METFYHGTSVLFKRFDLTHALEGDGKAKFGFGVYVTEAYKTAAHYAFNKKRPENIDFYVYTIKIPSITPDNHLFSNRPVHPAILERASKALGEDIPMEATTQGKLFRKYVGNMLTGQRSTVKKMIGRADIHAEKAATKFFSSIGVEFYVWPQSQNNPDGITNRAVLDESKISIVKIDKVQLSPDKHQLVDGSETEISLDTRDMI